MRALEANAETVTEALPIEPPFHAVLSEEGADFWISAVRAFATATGGTVLPLDAGHYVHVDRPARVAEFIRRHTEGGKSG